MSRRKQSNPQHLGSDLERELPAGTFEHGRPAADIPTSEANANPITEGADEVNGDVHVCGKCRGEFIIISEFLQHKQTCCENCTVVIVNEGGQSNSENTDNCVQSELESRGLRDREDVNEEEEEIRINSDGGDDTKDKLEEGTEHHSLMQDMPVMDADDSREPMDFTVNHPKSENTRSPIMAKGLTSLPLPPSNFALNNMEHTKYAVSQIRHSISGSASPPTREDMAAIQDQLYTLQQQHLQQLQLIQHIQQQVNSYSAQQQKLLQPPKSISPRSTSSTPTLPTISLPSTGPQLPSSPQPPHLPSPHLPSPHLPSPHLPSPPRSTNTTSVLPPFIDSPSSGHPHRHGPPPPSFLPPGFPLPPHRPPFELLQQAAIPPISSPLHSVPPSPFVGGSGGHLGLHRKGKPSHVSVFDAKFAADDPFFRHKCRFCHKVFGSDSALQIHIRSHTGERPFKCNICGNRFSTKGNLKVHFQRHQARYPHIQMDVTPYPPSPPPQERPPPLGPPPIHPPSIHQVPMPTIPNDIAKLPVETTNASHQAVQPSSGSPNTSTNSDEFPVKATTNEGPPSMVTSEWHPPMTSPSNSDIRSPIQQYLLRPSSDLPRSVSVPPRPVSVPPRPASEPARSPSEPRPAPEIPRPASSAELCAPQSNLSPPLPIAVPMSSSQNRPPTSYPDFMPVTSYSDYMLPPTSYPEYINGSKENPFSSTPSSLKLLAEQGFRPSETSKLQELVENIEQKITDPNQCVICHRVLSCKSALQMHYRIHTGERPFRCKICSRSFTTKGNLKTHYGVHRSQPTVCVYHDCPICHKRFTNGIVLQQHLRFHAAEGMSIPKSMNFMRPHIGNFGPEIALQRPTPMMMNRQDLHHPHKSEQDKESLMNGTQLLSNSVSHMNGQLSDDMLSGENNSRLDEEKEFRDKERSDRMAESEEGEGLTERDIEEAMFTPSEPSQGDAASLSASFTDESQQPSEMQLPYHHERQLPGVEQANHHHDRHPSETETTNNQHSSCPSDRELANLRQDRRSSETEMANHHHDRRPSETELANHHRDRRPSETELANHHRDRRPSDTELANHHHDSRPSEIELANRDHNRHRSDMELANYHHDRHPSEIELANNHHKRRPSDTELANHHHDRHPSEIELANNHYNSRPSPVEQADHHHDRRLSEIELANNHHNSRPSDTELANHYHDRRPSEIELANNHHDRRPSETDLNNHHHDRCQSEIELANHHCDRRQSEIELANHQHDRCPSETELTNRHHQRRPSEIELTNHHHDRQPSEIELVNRHRFDHQRSLDNITNALKKKMAVAPLNNNTEIRRPNGEHFSEPQSPLSKSEENSMTSEKPSEVHSFGEDNLEHPLHIDETRMDSNGVLDLTARSSGETSPSMPQSQGLPTSTAAMFAGLGATNLLATQGPNGQLIYPPGRHPINNNTTCRFCGKVFACTSALQIHYRSHTKERPFKCDICGKGFSTRGNLKQHMLTHKIRDLPTQLFDPMHVNNSVMVPLPPQVPETREKELKPEPVLRSEHGVRPEHAVRSEEDCRSEENRSEHIEKSEPVIWPEHTGRSESEPVIRPEHTGRPESEPKPDLQPVHPSLKRTKAPCSSENEPPSKRYLKHQCSVCNKQFQSDSALQIHTRTHTGEKPFKCHICCRSFTTKGNMKVHMGTHMWNGGTRRGRRIAFDPPFMISPKEGEVFRNDFFGMRPPYEGGFFQYPSPLNGFTAMSKANEISVIQNHQTGPQQAHVPETHNSVIMKADGPNQELRELRELREMQENKIREMHETSVRDIHENSIREMHEKSFRELHENKIRELHESKMRELHENKIREMHEKSIREMRENTIRDLRENAMREMRENALREMRNSTMREMQENAMRDRKPDAEPERERLTTA